MKVVTLKGERLDAYRSKVQRSKDRIAQLTGQEFELEPEEERRWPLRRLCVELGAEHWVSWVNSWVPAPETRGKARNTSAPAQSDARFCLQALDDLAEHRRARAPVASQLPFNC